MKITKKIIFTVCAAGMAAVCLFSSCGVVENSAPDMLTFDGWGDSWLKYSSLNYNRITVNGEDGREFYCSVIGEEFEDTGAFFSYSQGGEASSEITVASGEAFSWICQKTEGCIVYKVTADSVNFSVIEMEKESGDIVGYAVVNIARTTDESGVTYYTPTVLKAVEFPAVNGENQNVTEEQVAKLIERAKS